MSKISSCAAADFKSWRSDWRLPLTAAVMLIFVFFDFRDLSVFASRCGGKVSAWGASMCFTPAYMITLFCLLTALLYSDAPFYGDHSQFLIIRTGRFNWIAGQVAYIALSSFILIAFIWVSVWIVLLPNISFKNDWGLVLKTMAVNPAMPADLAVRIYPPSGLEAFSPMGTAALSFLLSWLTAVFIGTLFMFFNTTCGKTVSLSIFGFLMFINQSVRFVGLLIFGEGVRYISPLSFCDLYSTSRFSGNSALPPLAYCLTVLSAGILIFAGGTIISFCRGDISFGKGDKKE